MSGEWTFFATESQYKKFRPDASWPTWSQLMRNDRDRVVRIEDGRIAVVVDAEPRLVGGRWVRLATPSTVVNAVTPSREIVAAQEPIYLPLVEAA